MPLVSYSDSESDSETPTTKQAPAKAAPQDSAASKTSFQKVINRAEPNKIRVNLASLSQTVTSNGEDGRENERPVKRAKLGGTFSDFNAFLPAPKNPSKTATGSGASSSTGQLGGRSSGMASGVSLKTGAEPTFQRHQATVEDEPIDDVVAEAEDPIPPETKEEEAKLAAKVTMFKPLSVSRNQKKKPASSKFTPTATNGKPPDAAARSKTMNAALPPPKPKPKRSLFAAPEEERPAKSVESSTDYQPMFIQKESIEDGGEVSSAYNEQGFAGQQESNQGRSLEQLADSMQLSASERRQLFGRRGKPTDAQVAQFSLAAEYAHNRELLEKQDTAPQHNPVKSIAPGKHSLQQLMNAATSNKDALEESFIRGKTNKKEAGSKYGW